MPVAFYARLTDAEGEYSFRVQVMSLTDDSLIMRGETGPIGIKGRLGIAEIGLHLPAVPFPKPGRYEFQLFGNDVYLGRATVDVAGREGGSEDAGD